MITYRFFKVLITYIREVRILKQIYRNEDVVDNLSRSFGVTFRKDWVNRIYAVFNPLIHIPEEERIFENTDQGLSLASFVERAIMTRLVAVQDMLTEKMMFDITTYHIDRLDDNENYLFVIEPESWQELLSATKKFAILLAVLLIIAIVTTIIIL